MTQQELFVELNKRIRQSRAAMSEKVLQRPFRIVFPWILEKFGWSTKAIARTFWGGRMEVVLPELVSTHLYRYGFFDRDVSFYMIDSLKDGGTFIDIGSHFGSFSLLANQLVGSSGKVLSIDPTPSTFSLMEKNMTRFAAHRNYQTFNLALYDTAGTASFYDFGLTRSAYNSVLGSRDEAIKDSEEFKIQVRTETLDNLANSVNPKRIDFIKIDAESAELAILKGSRNVLKKFSPRVTVEIGDTGLPNAPKSIDIIGFLESEGYKTFELSEDRLVEHKKRADYTKDTLPCYNLLFIKN